MISPSNFELTFIGKKQLTSDLYTFYFKKPRDFIFHAGQYIKLSLPIQNPDERGINRLFTISSSPLDQNLSITTRIIQSSFKKYLDQINPGFKLLVYGPLGKFTLSEQDIIPYIFIAGGMGITTFHSMITYVNQKKLTIPITLFASFSRSHEIVFYEELSHIENKNIKIIYTITKPEESKKPWNGEIGRISKDLIKKYAHNYLESKYYIVGPMKMVVETNKQVQELGIEKESILKETFTGY